MQVQLSGNGHLHHQLYVGQHADFERIWVDIDAEAATFCIIKPMKATHLLVMLSDLKSEGKS